MMNLQETIRRIIREELNESTYLRRRIDMELFEKEFYENLNYATNIFLTSRRERQPVTFPKFKKRVMDYLIDNYHSELTNGGLSDDYPYDEVYEYLSSHFHDKIKERYDVAFGEDVNESVNRIAEGQQGSIKIELLNMVKDMGWRLSAKVINGSEKLAKLAFNNDPMEFLHMFDDMDIVQSESNQYWTLFRYKERYNLMVYQEGIKQINVSYKDIWSFLTMGFDLRDSEIKEIINIWLDEVYNIRGVEPFELLEFNSGNNQMKRII